MPTASILGTEYDTVIMPGGLEWMAEELAYPTPGDSFVYSLTGVTVYNGSGLAIIGALLDDGWRVPTFADYVAMVTQLADVTWTDPITTSELFEGAGGHLKKATPGFWRTPTAGADDLYGFGAISTDNAVSVASLNEGRYWLADEASPGFNLAFRLDWDLLRITTTTGALAGNLYAIRLVREPVVPIAYESTTVEYFPAIEWTEAIDGTPVAYDDGATFDYLEATITLRCSPAQLTELEAAFQASPPVWTLDGTGFLLGPGIDHTAGVTVTLLDLQVDGPADSAMTLFDATIRVHYGPMSAPSAGSLAVVLGRGVPYHAPAAENSVWVTVSGTVDSSAFSRRSTRSTRWYCNSLTYAQAADALDGLRTLRTAPTIWAASGLGRPFGPGEPQSNTVWIPRWRIFRGSNLTWDFELEVVRNG